MKKIFLLSALLILACSSDDSTSDDNNQLFLEKYDGVVWNWDDDSGDDSPTLTRNEDILPCY